jgi:predicted ATP-dependent endonuclease of OLD family
VSLLGFGVKNLRCLTDTGIVPIKPITLLVGRNSSGKSTFLRAFPLLRQSMENARSSPILWEHPDYVDFGNIDLAINGRSIERSVTFEFAAEWPEDEYIGRCDLRMEVAASTAGPHVRSYDLCLDQKRIRLEFDGEHRLLHVDGKLDDVVRGGICGSAGRPVSSPLSRRTEEVDSTINLTSTTYSRRSRLRGSRSSATFL